MISNKGKRVKKEVKFSQPCSSLAPVQGQIGNQSNASMLTLLEICHVQHDPFRFELPNQGVNSQKLQFISHLVRNNGPYIARNTNQSQEKLQEARTCVMCNKPNNIPFQHFSKSPSNKDTGRWRQNNEFCLLCCLLLHWLIKPPCLRTTGTSLRGP
jgi:hypothetical protein